MGHYLGIICKLALFLMSNLGLWEYFRRKSGINIFFIPAFTICLQVTVLFCAGVLNCLKPAVVLMFGAGIFLVVYYLYTDFKNVIHTYWNGGYVFLTVSFFVLLLACHGKVFVHYDNFSHWGLVVKNMLMTDRYPSFQDTMIIFQEYPLGSASYIYYFAKLISNSEGMQMAAQGFMMLCFILPAFKYLRRNMIVGWGCICVFANYIFCCNILITSLLVDTLLPLQAMAMLFFIYSECLKLDNENTGGGVSCLYAIPFLCMTVQIKNSGIYFVILACILFCISLKSDKAELKCNRTMIRNKVLAMIVPFVSIYLWHAHCGYVFLDSSVTKHAMTFQNYRDVFSQKSENDITAIMSNVFEFFTSGKELYNLILFILIIGVLSFFKGTRMRKKYLKTVSACVVIYITYMVGTAGMYLFSMPEGEAANLAGIGRYRSTIFIAIYYILCLFSMTIISSVEDIRKGWLYPAGIYLALIIVWAKETDKPFPHVFDYIAAEERVWLEQAIEENEIPAGASYLVCVPPESAGDYMRHMCRYIFWSDNVSHMRITDAAQLKESGGNFEYILIYDDENVYIQEWVSEYYPEQVGKSVIVNVR